MRPIASLASELRIAGIGQIVIGLVGLAIALLRDDVAASRALVPFAATSIALAAVSVWSSKWLRDADPAPAPPDAPVEERSGTLRRCSVSLVVGVVAIAAGTIMGGGLSAVLGGVLAGVGIVDLLNRRAVRAREDADGVEIFRELGNSPFAAGRRPLYTRPRNDVTLLT